MENQTNKKCRRKQVRVGIIPSPSVIRPAQYSYEKTDEFILTRANANFHQEQQQNR